MSKILTIEKKVFAGLFDETKPTFYGRNHPSFDGLFWAVQDVYTPVERAEAEVSEQLIQPIPYCTFANLLGYLTYARKGTEQRLHGFRSVGIGGHIDFEDGTLKNGLIRELKEEVGLKDPEWNYRRISGFIYDPTTAVGRVHLGIVSHFIVRPDEITAEEELFDAKWVGYDELARTIEEYELWSQLTLRNCLL